MSTFVGGSPLRKVAIGSEEVSKVYSGFWPVWSKESSFSASWEQVKGIFNLTSPSGAYVTSVDTAPPSGAMAVIDTGKTDGAVKCELVEGAAKTNNMSLMVKYVNDSSYIHVRRDGALGRGNLIIRLLGIDIYTSPVFNLDQRFTIEVAGKSTSGGIDIRVISNGTLVHSYKFNSTYTSVFDASTKYGILYRGDAVPANDCRWKGWEWYELNGSLGRGWESWGGSTWRISGGAAHRYSTGGDPLTGISVMSTLESDVRIQTVVDPMNGARIIFRAQDEDNYLYLKASVLLGLWQLSSRIDGVDTLISLMTMDTSPGSTLEVVLFGNKVRFRTNGSFVNILGTLQQTLELPPNTDFLKNATYHGIGYDVASYDGSPGPRWHSWRVEPVRTWGADGATLLATPGTPWTGSQVDPLQIPVPVLDLNDAVSLLWGMNDAIAMSPRWYARGIETILSRLRGRAYLDGEEIAVGPWTKVHTRSHNTSDGYLKSDSPSSYMSFEVHGVADEGPMLAVAFVALDGGGVASVELESTQETTIVDTNVGESGYEPLFVERIPIGPFGNTNIHIRVVSGSIAVDSIWLESRNPPRVAVGNIPKFLHGADFTATAATSTTVTNSNANWPTNKHVGATVRIYDGPGAIQDRTIISNTATTITISSPWDTLPVPGQSRVHVNQVGSPWGDITDLKIKEMNRELEASVAKFSNATLVDIDSLLDRNPAYFSVDGIHPTSEGYDIIAKAFADTLGESSVWNSLWIFGHSYSIGKGSMSNGFDHHLVRRLHFFKRLVDDFDRPDDRGRVVAGGF